MKSMILVLVSLFISTSSYGESWIPPRGVLVKNINDSSFLNDNTYFSFETECAGMGSCVAVRVERGSATEEQLERIKKIFYLAQTLKKRIEYTSIGSDRVDISQPITLLGE